MSARRSFIWQCRDHQLLLGEQTVIMGILNVTPDSFSDGGSYPTADAAVSRALDMAQAGAGIIDVGGESTRPGADPVSVEDEIARVVPVIEQLTAASEVLISIDTTKALVAEAALEAGAHIVNDVSACTMDPEMTAVAARYRAGVVLMHMQGQPQTMQADPQYDDVVIEVRDYLAARVEAVVDGGVAPAAICVDPGIGFGKTLDHNLALLLGLPALASIAAPVLVGLSRKRFLGAITGNSVDQRLAESLAGLVHAIDRGAHILRVHDVKESCEAAAISDMLLRKESQLE